MKEELENTHTHKIGMSKSEKKKAARGDAREHPVGLLRFDL